MKKTLNVLGMALFIGFLGMNVYSALENPYLFVTAEAVAQCAECDSESGDDDNNCISKPQGFDCDHGGQGALSCSIYESVLNVYVKECTVTCEGNGCYACCDDVKDRCICVTFS